MFYTYLLASGLNGTLYVGSTEGLLNRVDQHKTKAFPGFTAKYGVDKLVWYEPHEHRDAAFIRERQIKEWRRLWKIQLIERGNPNWKDLAEGWKSASLARKCRACGKKCLGPGFRRDERIYIQFQYYSGAGSL